MRPALVVLAALAAQPALAQEAADASAIDAATYEGGELPEGYSHLTVRLQALLDRSGISPGVIDGIRGGMSESAIRAFEEREGMEVDGLLDPEVWAALGAAGTGPLTATHTVTAEDLAEVGEELPEDYAALAELDQLGFERASEALAERFHMAEDLLLALNPGAGFAEGESIVVIDPGEPLEAQVARIEVRKATNRLAAFDAEGNMVANYPVTIGSDDNPSPEGNLTVVAVAEDPTYHYDPENFVQGDNTEPLVLPPGPNGPVGSTWIDLSEPTYGLHGTAEPGELFERSSHGCVRLTNWDVAELATLVSEGTVVEFTE